MSQTPPWIDRVLFQSEPGIAVAPSDSPAGEFADAVSARGWKCHHTSLAGITDKATLLDVLGTTVGAFDGWGRNWDALVDVFRSLDADVDHVLLLDDCGDPSIYCPAEWATMLSIARQHISDRQPGQPVLRLVLRSDDPLSGYRCP